MKDKKRTVLTVFLCVSALAAVSLAVFRSILMLNYFDYDTMQYLLEKTYLNTILIVFSMVFAAAAFILFFLLKDHELNEVRYHAPVRIVSGVLFLAIGLYGMISILSVDQSVAARLNNFKIHQLLVIVSSIFALVSSAYLFISVKGVNKSIGIISVSLPLWAAFGILASYFNPFYTLLDPNRIVYDFMLLSASIMFIKACKNLFYDNKQYMSSVLAAMVSMTMSAVFLIPNLAYIFSKGKPLTLFAPDNLSALVICILSVSILISGLKKNKAALN